MAGTLANGGTCPITGERILSSDAVSHVLALMGSCGMSIYSGQFAFENGLPAISSSSGAIMLVIPDVAGITIFSPKLDHLNNPVRGVDFCHELIKLYQFHKYDTIGGGSSVKLDPTLKRQSIYILATISFANHYHNITCKAFILTDSYWRYSCKHLPVSLVKHTGNTPFTQL